MIKYQKKVLNVFYLSVILTDSVYKTGKNYYPQLLLEECKYVVKEKKMPEYITDNIEISPNASDEKNSDNEYSNEENVNEGN